jgi:hypothetical protein
VTQKTVRISRPKWDAWKAAMLGGEYQQAQNTLCLVRGDGSKGYCCLGVMEAVISGEPERRISEHGDFYLSLPSPEWLAENGIAFRTMHGETNRDPDALVEHWNFTNPVVWVSPEAWEGLKQYESEHNALTDYGWHPVGRLNDSGVPFTDIAALLEPHVEFID